MMQTQNSPFAEKININRFFPGSGRGALLVELHNAIVGNVPFITLTGDEGSGKSFLCELVASKLPKNVTVVTVPAGIESFEDILKLIVQEIGVILSTPDEESTIQDKLDILQSWLEEHDVKLLVVFDEAESIYLATLERTRKNIVRTNKEADRFTLLLSGRPMLMENLRQLSMCNFESTSEKHFSLSPMTADETYEYLNYSMKEETGSEEKEVFSREASDKIFEIAQGNHRMTNVLAEEALQNIDQDTSFMVLLDNVREKEVDGGQVKRRLDLSSNWWKQKKILPFLGGTAGLLLIIMLLFPWGDETVEQVKEKEIEVVIEKKNPARKPVELKEEKAEPEKTKQKVAVKPVSKEEKKPVPVKEAEQKPDEKPEVVNQKKVAEKQVVKKEEPKPEPEAKTLPEKKPQVIPEDKPEPIVAKKPEEKPVQHIKEQKKIKKAPVEKTILPLRDKYDERLVAGVSWLHGGADGKYTVQLMVLTSENAEENLRKMLKEKGYQSVADNMYILQKSGADSPILVFYGEYASMSEARNARNTLPKILRKHNPYAISVEGAVHKAQ